MLSSILTYLIPLLSISTPAAAGASQSQSSAAGNTTVSSYRNAVYFTNWGIYGANFQPQQLPASQITHVLYSFADIKPDGQVILTLGRVSSDTYADLEKHYPGDSWSEPGENAYGCVKQMYLLKKKNRNMKFPPVAATEEGRRRFASSAVKLVQDWGFDGLDIDWEYPTNALEARNFVLLLRACRQALDDYARQYAPGYHFLITIAAPAGPQHYGVMDLPGMNPYIDSWHLMAYDYAGSWDSTTGHQANLLSNPKNLLSTKFNTDQAVRDFIRRGIPASKIVLGLPFYGRSFENTDGLGKPYNGIGAGTLEPGTWVYRDLPRPGAKEEYDNVAKASYSYDAASRELISYDNVLSALVKTKYIFLRGLGGAVFWEASGDKTGAKSLIGTLATQMKRLDQTKNLLSYPASRYANIRAGVPGS
ncbi:chitinase 1 precursor [Neurospora tetraspora]|uniref:chitinase n=1 Tax=Neurospora tetraspora TaxID=94610 RepID=A0AAE0JP94_9PEZI|nr:chitinase 1 precursor [Neurospora tetraspora]